MMIILKISWYNLIHSDHPSNNKCSGVCIYYKNFLSLWVLNVQYLQECNNFELNIGSKICNFISLYRSPSQTQDKFEKFIENLELHLENLSQNNLIVDFNAKSKNWYFQSQRKYNWNNVTAHFGLQQIIREAMHISNTSSSCIDLIFLLQPNLITDNLNLHIVYPPPYLQEIWYYRETQGLLDKPSKNLIGKEHFQTQALMKKVKFLTELFLIS